MKDVTRTPAGYPAKHRRQIVVDDELAFREIERAERLVLTAASRRRARRRCDPARVVPCPEN